MQQEERDCFGFQLVRKEVCVFIAGWQDEVMGEERLPLLLETEDA